MRYVRLAGDLAPGVVRNVLDDAHHPAYGAGDPHLLSQCIDVPEHLIGHTLVHPHHGLALEVGVHGVRPADEIDPHGAEVVPGNDAHVGLRPRVVVGPVHVLQIPVKRPRVIPAADGQPRGRAHRLDAWERCDALLKKLMESVSRGTVLIPGAGQVDLVGEDPLGFDSERHVEQRREAAREERRAGDEHEGGSDLDDDEPVA